MESRSRPEPLHRRMQRAERPCGLRGCDWHGCAGEGLYRAPRSRRRLNEYWWFCLDHIRLYNASWDYYEGMSEQEVEADVRRDTVWQRPSWPLGSSPYRMRMRFFDEAVGNRPADEPPTPPRTAADRALDVLDLVPPVTVPVVKARYKELVKRYHPDANGGDKAAEERFKLISEAYRTVMDSLNG